MKFTSSMDKIFDKIIVIMSRQIKWTKMLRIPIMKLLWLSAILCLAFLTFLTIIFYSIYLFGQNDDLEYLVSSLKQMKSMDRIQSEQRFDSSLLPAHFTEYIQDYLAQNITQYLIISCDTGLGNRLQSIVSAFLMAVLMHRRLVIHWPETISSSCRFNQLFEPQSSSSWNLFDLYTKDYIHSNSDLLKFHGPFDELLCHPNLTLFKQQTQFLFILTDEYFLSVLMKNPHYSNTLFHNVNEDHLFRSLVNYLFVPIKQLRDQIDNHTSKMGQCDRGIQMRKWGLKAIEVNGEETFLKCAANQTKLANETWMVVSDHDPYKVYMKSHASSNRIKVWSLSTLANTRQCSNVQHAVVELWLLSKCRHLYVTEWSSFGWLASGISGTRPTIVSKSSCHVQPLARPCYYELTHIKQLSCYNHTAMLKDDGCCNSEGLCQTSCLHHQLRSGLHPFYFLLLWPTLPLVKWLVKWVAVTFVFVLLVNTIIIKMRYVALMRVLRTVLEMIPFICVAYIDIRCLVWTVIEFL